MPGVTRASAALVVPVDDDALSRNAGAKRERELAERGDVRAEPLGGEEPEQGEAR
jgi:hypothetical protein